MGLFFRQIEVVLCQWFEVRNFGQLVLIVGLFGQNLHGVLMQLFEVMIVEEHDALSAEHFVANLQIVCQLWNSIHQ